MAASYPHPEFFVTPPHDFSVRFFQPDRASTDQHRILIVAVAGTYPDGSLGKAQGHYIAVQTMLGLHAFDPDALVLDLRELHDRYGDTLMQVFQEVSQFRDAARAPEEPYFPISVITSAPCRTGFLSLVTPAGGGAPSLALRDVGGGHPLRYRPGQRVVRLLSTLKRTVAG